MSIADKIATLQSDKTAIRNAVLSMNGTCPLGNGFNDFATDILTIQSGASPDLDIGSTISATAEVGSTVTIARGELTDTKLVPSSF